MKKSTGFFFAFCFAAGLLYGEISFSGGVINQRDEVLFAADTSVPSMPSYRTLFKKDLATGKVEQLTFFPEQMELLSGGTVLQIRNRFGAARYDAVSGQFTVLDAFPSLNSGFEPYPGVLEKSSASPDGRWIAAVQPVSPARGRILLTDVNGRTSQELSASAGRGRLPVSWAPDSSVLIYEDSGSLYYARPETVFSGEALEARYRIIGTGSVRAVSWYGPSRFLYACGNGVYRVHVPELFGYSVYRPLISVGELAGKLPAPFNPEEDRICASPDGASVLYVAGNRCAYFFPLYGDDYAGGNGSVPCLLLPGNTAEVFPFWTERGSPAVFARTVDGGVSVLKGWILSGAAGANSFLPVNIPADALQVLLSPDGSYAAFVGASGVSVYSVSSWTEVAEYASGAVSAVWIDGSSLYVGGRGTVSRWNFKTGTSEIVTVSSVSGYSWDEQGTVPVAFVNAGAEGEAGPVAGAARFRCTGNRKWELAAGTRAGAPATANARYRLYLDRFDGIYENMIYVRSAGGKGGTEPIVPVRESPDAEEFRRGGAAAGKHGERAAVALVFDAMDECEGLPEILSALHDYGMQATFFLNGEFLRRHPRAAEDIQKAGHQTASMFFTSWDLSDPDFRIDADFVQRGLARNEDDFHSITGGELSLYWHAPYYVVSPEILRGGGMAGYTYVPADVFVPDWVTADQSASLPGLYKSADEIIDSILEEVRPGDVIPVRVGKPAEGTREDYLYSRIRVLLNALSDQGYTVVPVNRL